MTDAPVAASELPPPRTRRVRRAYVYFTMAEWGRVQARMRADGQTKFTRWARPQLLGGGVPTKEDRQRQRETLRQLVGVCTNLNQIARHVNTERHANLDQLRAAITLAETTCELVESAWEPADSADLKGV